MSNTIFLVEDNPVHQEIVHCGLTRMGYEVIVAENAEEALETVQHTNPDLFLIDLRLPGRDGFSFCEDLDRQRHLSMIPRIILTGVDKTEDEVQGLLGYADDYVTKPFDFKSLFARIEALLRRVKRINPHSQITSSKKISKKDSLECEIFESRLVGACDEMRMVFEKIRKFASNKAPVLLTGENGTGKRLAAKTIHQLSNQQYGSFVTLDCGALPKNRIETVLFGNEKDTFTDIVSPGEGKVELANGGTLFLQNVDELPLSLQAKLVGFLEDSCFERNRGTRMRSANVRIVAAANRGHEKEIASQSFRDELNSILYTHILSLPPLRDRGEDSVIIAKCLFEALTYELDSSLEGFTCEALDAIRFYCWPGNVRELANSIRRAFNVARGSQIGVTDLGIKPASLIKTSLGR